MKSTQLVRSSVVLVLALGLPACTPKKVDKAASAEAVQAGLEDALQHRRKRMIAALPSADVPQTEGDEHPWLDWIKKAASTPPIADVEKAGVKAKGDAEEQVALLSKWLQAQKDYYLDAKIEPNEYWTVLAGARRVSKGMPWEQDVEFDALFFHAQRLANTWNLFATDAHDDRVTNFFTYWKFVFDFQPKTSLYQEEVNIVCATKLDGYCKDIPMEERPYQVMKPYYEGYIKQVDAYKAKFAQSPFNPFLDRIAAQFRDRIGKVPKWVEFPVLAEIRSTNEAPIGGNAVLQVTEKGVILMDNVLRAPEKGWKADWLADPKLAEEVQVLVEGVRSTTSSQYNQSLIKVLPEGTVPVRYLEPLLRTTITGEHSKEWAVMWLVGRRHVDGSNRRAGYEITVLAADKTIPFKIKQGTGKPAMCTAWAVVGKDPYEAKGFQAVVFNDGKQVHMGRLGAEDAITGDQPVNVGLDSADRLDTWMDGQTTSVVVAVPEGVAYATLLEALNGVALDCTKAGGPGAGAAADQFDECKLARNQPVFIATCK